MILIIAIFRTFLRGEVTKIGAHFQKGGDVSLIRISKTGFLRVISLFLSSEKFVDMNLRFFLLLALGFSLFGASAQEQENAVRTTFHTISSHDLLDYAAELSSQKYGGRLSGSPGYEAAARWVAGQLEEAGVKPGMADGTYFQWFPNAYSDVLSPGKVVLLPGKHNARKRYHFPDDYFPGSNSASGTVAGEVVYAGFGISAPELGYDDYHNLDVKGKIVLLETGLPYNRNDSTLLKWEPYSYHRYKFSRARELGAAGLLYVSKIANPNTSFLEGLVYAHISEAVAEELFDGTGKQYAETRGNIVKSLVPNSFRLHKRVKISASTKHYPDSRSCNVVGIIEGADPQWKEEAILVGAHLDGVGSPGSLFPGALDNASGSADILAAAKALAASEVKPARTVIFLFFGGEECGLYGSQQFADAPVWSKEKVVGMINLDMVGNGTGFFMSNGKTYQELYRHFEEANNRFLHREMNASETRISYGRPRTDAAVFDKYGYKTLSLWTSGSVKPVFYHHPLDNTDALTPEIMEDAAKLLYLGILGIANDPALKTN